MGTECETLPTIVFFFYIFYIFTCFTCYRERGGVVVERRTPNREGLGSIPTGATVLCP